MMYNWVVQWPWTAGFLRACLDYLYSGLSLAVYVVYEKQSCNNWQLVYIGRVMETMIWCKTVYGPLQLQCLVPLWKESFLSL